MRWRIRPNGDLFAPKRGTPPCPPEGYYRDRNDPFLAHPCLPECEARFIGTETLSCGKILKIIECSELGREVSQKECSLCQKVGFKKPLNGQGL